MDKGIQASREYFAKRAERYALALKQMPNARILDLLPYLYAFSELNETMGKPIEHLDILDAFGGTGFLSHSLMRSGIQFKVGDACSEMLSLGDRHLDGINYEEVVDNFEAMSQSKPSSLDCVVCHGGLHHVISQDQGIVNLKESKRLQADTISNMAALVRPGGFLIIADIAALHSPSCYYGNEARHLKESQLRKLLSLEQIGILKALDINCSDLNLKELGSVIRERFSKEVAYPVPRYFFDEFVAKKTVLGHDAAFSERKSLIEVGQAAGLEEHWSIDYRGPWLFQSRNDAGWYFREKFSCGQSSLPGADPNSEERMAASLETYLGTRGLGVLGFAVNWGVNYVCMKKPC